MIIAHFWSIIDIVVQEVEDEVYKVEMFNPSGKPWQQLKFFIVMVNNEA
jgi:hypothetical protein